MDWTNSTFWIALLEIVWVNILLSGDNAVVIALAARNLKPQHQRTAIIGGSFAAIVMRVLLTIFAVNLLQLPWLKFVGSLALLYIGVQLLMGEDDKDDDKDGASHSVWSAVRTILIADLVMSLDNVLAVAGAAASAPETMRTPLLIIGLGLSVPLIVFGSTLLLRLMERLPVIITLGAALLGWVAGEMALSDAGLLRWLQAQGGPVPAAELAGAVGAGLVLLIGFWQRRRTAQSTP
ncbi:MAG TPA: TerC family protein [Burkholderiaceae bacterium]|jgi:YjbE family integral membrane protein